MIKKLIRSLAALGALVSTSCSQAKDNSVAAPYDAPAVSGVDQDGKTVDFSSVYQRGITVVYFYPKADTPGCTKQGCSLRDAYAELTAAGVTVLGVSTDKPESNKKFKEKYRLPFTLISDPEGRVLDAFKVSKVPLLGLASRQCFLIKDGKVVWHDATASTDQQAADILAELKKLK